MDWLAAPDYWLARLIFQRLLAAIYLIGFLVALDQFRPLLGERGLLPAPDFIRQVPFRRSPSLFYVRYSDRVLVGVATLGGALAFGALLGAPDLVPLPIAMLWWALLWALYLSIVNVGQTFYAFGWESLLCETGFLAIFLGAAGTAPSFAVIVLMRWLVFRVEFGAGLIKMRGDRCWRDLTCLYYHHETQPMPNPLSWYFHHLPKRIHRVEVLGNHFAQLVAPWFLFAPQPVATIAGIVIVGTQAWLLVSGNFAWLFGSVTKERYEVVIEGTDDAVLTPQTAWREYEFKGKPTDVRRRPAQIAPYHLRLDWLMWFAALSSPMYQEWFVPFLWKLLEADRPTLRLLARDPFQGKRPRFVRAQYYLYRFTTPAERRETGAWWHRELSGIYVPAVKLRG